MLLFTVSCKKEIVTAPQQTFNVSASELTSVKQWFTTGNNLDLLAKPASWLNSTSAKWDKAYSQTFNKQNVYELAISNPDRIFAATGTVDTKQVERYENRSLIRLLVFEDLITKEKTSCFMVMVAGESYDLKQTPLTELHYADYKEFTGVVDFYSLNGDLVNGWNLEKGKVTGSPKAGVSNTTSPIRNQKLMYVLPPEDCNTREEPRWRQLCNTVYPIEGMSGEPITTCNPEMYYVTVVLSCPETGGPGTYTPPGGTEGAPDPNNPSPNIMDSLAAYPCAQGLVQTMPTIKSEIANKINALFGRNETMNILFVADASLVGTSTDGQLKSYAGTTTAGTFKIALNPDVLNKASKEFILVTLYHEALHAYLAYKK